MWQNILIPIVLGFVTTYLSHTLFARKHTKTPSIELLKNALLAHALAMTKQSDIDSVNNNYALFDGTKLPLFSGYSISNAYFSYIICKEDM